MSLEHQINQDGYMPRSKFLLALNDKFINEDVLFIGTTGNTSREMYSFMPNTNNFYMAGNMGGALSLGFGAAKAGKKVIVCGGDAEFVMHLGGITTAGRYNDINLKYIIFDNKSNKSTGGQKSYQQHLDYLSLARSCDVLSTFEVNSVDEFEVGMNNIKESEGLSVIHVNCSYDPMAARPDKEIIKGSKNLFLLDN